MDAQRCAAAAADSLVPNHWKKYFPMLLRGVTGGRAPFDVLDAAATTFLEAASGDYGAHGKVARMLRGRNVAPRGGARRDPLRDVTFGRPEGEAFDPSRNLFWRATGGRPEGALAAVLGRAAGPRLDRTSRARATSVSEAFFEDPAQRTAAASAPATPRPARPLRQRHGAPPEDGAELHVAGRGAGRDALRAARGPVGLLSFVCCSTSAA